MKKSRTVGNDDYNYDDGEGYYLNGFNGSQSDYEYATRIRRFHNPRFTITIGDPGYNDIYFLNSSDWNVYIDGPYAWVTPTWSNPWYWNYTWAPASYGSWTWRMYPWGPYWGGGISWNWGYNWGWNSWYYPHYHHYHGYYPHSGSLELSLLSEYVIQPWNIRPKQRS